MTVLQERAIEFLILRRRDDQNIADPCKHERAQRVVDHRLVIDRHELLGNDHGQRVKARPGAAGQYDTFFYQEKHLRVEILHTIILDDSNVVVKGLL